MKSPQMTSTLNLAPVHAQAPILKSLFAFLALSLAASGCVALAPYTPNRDKADQLGEEESKKKFAEVLTRSSAPRYSGVELTADFFKCQRQQLYVGAWYATHTVESSVEIHFANISRVEVYVNHKVFLYGLAEDLIFEALFPSQEDAFLFADIINSYRAKRGKSP